MVRSERRRKRYSSNEEDPMAGTSNLVDASSSSRFSYICGYELEYTEHYFFWYDSGSKKFHDGKDE